MGNAMSAPTLERRAGDVLLDALRAQVDELREQGPLILRRTPGAVTHARVLTRQMRSVLRGFNRVLDPRHTEALAEELKWLGAQLAAERDAEAMIEHFTQVVRTLPGELIMGSVTTDLEQALSQLAEAGDRTVLDALASERYRALLELLDRLVADPPFTHRADRPAREELPKSVAKAFGKLDRRLAAADVLPPGPDRDEALHEARKADKQLRYMTEVVAPVIGTPARRLRRQSKKLQELLGEYQDAVVARPVLRQLGASAYAHGHDSFTYGLLYALEEARTERVLRELPARLAHLHDSRTYTWLPTKPAPQLSEVLSKFGLSMPATR
jgi:CHAD domain-containing protein